MLIDNYCLLTAFLCLSWVVAKQKEVFDVRVLQHGLCLASCLLIYCAEQLKEVSIPLLKLCFLVISSFLLLFNMWRGYNINKPLSVHHLRQIKI